MDSMDFKSKMGSAILIAATGAIFGACVAFLIGRRGKKRKSPEKQNGSTQDLLVCELDECRRLIDELRTRLEHETERRNESETWNRKLENDLVNLAAARRASEETCVRLCRDLDRLKEELHETTSESSVLQQFSGLGGEDKLPETTSTTGSCTGKMPSAVRRSAPEHERRLQAVAGTNSHSPTRSFGSEEDLILAREVDISRAISARVACRSDKSPATRFEHSGSPGPTVGDVYGDDDPSSPNGVTQHALGLLTPTGNISSSEHTVRRKDDYCDDDGDDDYCSSDDDDEDDYSDYGEDVPLSDAPLLQRNLSEMSDDNFELGKDVMGALIASAFKDGVIETRNVDNAGQSEEQSPEQPSESQLVNGHTGPEQSEVSLESIGDTKTTRQFWEQIIAADKYEDNITDDDDEDDTSDEDATNEYDDVMDEDGTQPCEKTSGSSPAGAVLGPGTGTDTGTGLEPEQKARVVDQKQAVSSRKGSRRGGDVITNGSHVTIYNGLDHDS